MRTNSLIIIIIVMNKTIGITILDNSRQELSRKIIRDRSQRDFPDQWLVSKACYCERERVKGEHN